MGRAGREEGVDGGGVVRRREDPPEGGHDRVRDLLAAQLIRGLGADPAPFAAGLHHLRHDRVDEDLPVPELRRFLVHLRQDGEKHPPAHPHGRLQDHVEGLFAVVGEIGILRQRRRIELFVKQELQVPQTDEFFRHDALLFQAFIFLSLARTIWAAVRPERIVDS